MAWLISQAMVNNYLNSPCLQEQAAESLVASCSDGEQSVPLNSTPTPQAYWLRGKTTAVWKGSRFGRIFAVSDQQTHNAERCLRHFARSVIGSLSVADSLAKTSQQQDAEKGSTASGRDCGASLRESFAKFDRDTHVLRTHHYSLFGGWIEYSGTLPRWGTMQNGELSRQRIPSGLRELRQSITDAKESGLLQPMPTPDCNGGGQGPSQLERHGPRLATAVMLPTPNARDWKDSASNEALIRAATSEGGQLNLPRAIAIAAPTPTVCGNYNRKGASKTSGDGLATFAQQLPTPSACQRGDCESERNRRTPGLVSAVKMPTPNAMDNRNRGGSESNAVKRRGEIGKQLGLSMSVDEKSGALNPSWVEWLMGWPIHWTDLTEVAIPHEGWCQEPEGIPRVANGIANRARRLTAIGNGQCPQAMALAWNILGPLQTAQ